jgi:type IV pilus modification protein PilV
MLCMYFKKNQSAFSLIEVMIALLVLSLGVLGASKLLMQTVIYYREAELREKATVIALSMAETVRVRCSQEVEKNSQYWQEKFKTEFPGSVITVSRTQTVGEGCVYNIKMSFAGRGINPLIFRVGT